MIQATRPGGEPCDSSSFPEAASARLLGADRMRVQHGLIVAFIFMALLNNAGKHPDVGLLPLCFHFLRRLFGSVPPSY